MHSKKMAGYAQNAELERQRRMDIGVVYNDTNVLPANSNFNQPARIRRSNEHF